MEILSLLLKLVHMICTLKDIILNITLTLRKSLQLNVGKYLARGGGGVGELKRVPIHLGIVLVENEVSYKDLANMVIWCMLTGISYISIYDRSGTITFLFRVGV